MHFFNFIEIKIVAIGQNFFYKPKGLEPYFLSMKLNYLKFSFLKEKCF